MSIQTSKNRELRDALLHFTTSYLEDQPGDVINYAVEYFKQLQVKRKTLKIEKEQDEEPKEKIDDREDVCSKDIVTVLDAYRRKSVFAAAYNPNKDLDQFQDGLNVYPKTDEQKSLLVNSFNDILIFKTINKDQINKLIDTMYEKNVEENDLIVAQGTEGEHFYVIESGTFNVYVDNNLVHTFQDSGHFGEVALLYNESGSATVTAATNGKLWVLKRETFRRIVLKAAYKKRKIYEHLLNSTPLLGMLKNYERTALVDALVSMQFKKDDRIIKQGDVGDGMYFIEEGEVALRLEQEDGSEIEQTILHKGSYFGELALITHLPRAASCYALTDCTVAFLENNCFKRLIGNFMEIFKRNMPLYEETVQKMLLKNSHC